MIDIRSKWFLILMFISTFIAVIYGLWVGTEKNKSFEEGYSKSLVTQCLESNKQALNLIGKNSDDIDLERYCNCSIQGTIELSKQNIDTEKDIIGVYKFLDEYAQTNCLESQLLTQLNAEERSKHFSKTCEMVFAVDSATNNQLDQKIDCQCFSEKINTIVEKGIVNTDVGILLYTLNNPDFSKECLK